MSTRPDLLAPGQVTHMAAGWPWRCRGDKRPAPRGPTNASTLLLEPIVWSVTCRLASCTSWWRGGRIGEELRRPGSHARPRGRPLPAQPAPAHFRGSKCVCRARRLPRARAVQLTGGGAPPGQGLGAGALAGPALPPRSSHGQAGPLHTKGGRKHCPLLARGAVTWGNAGDSSQNRQGPALSPGARTGERISVSRAPVRGQGCGLTATSAGSRVRGTVQSRAGAEGGCRQLGELGAGGTSPETGEQAGPEAGCPRQEVPPHNVPLRSGVALPCSRAPWLLLSFNSKHLYLGVKYSQDLKDLRDQLLSRDANEAQSHQVICPRSHSVSNGDRMWVPSTC